MKVEELQQVLVLRHPLGLLSGLLPFKYCSYIPLSSVNSSIAVMNEPLGSSSLVNQTTSTAALDVLQYIQRCGGSGLVYETRDLPSWL